MVREHVIGVDITGLHAFLASLSIISVFNLIYLGVVVKFFLFSEIWINYGPTKCFKTMFHQNNLTHA